MEQLIRYLLENLIIDFQGEMDLEMARGFLNGDDSKFAKALYARMLADGGVSDMMVVLGDCLKEYVNSGINEKVVHDQLLLYLDS